MREAYSYTQEVIKEKIAYYFETDQEVRYVAYFSVCNQKFGNPPLNYRIFEFALELFNISEVKPPKGTKLDFRIKATIEKIFIEFLDSPDKVVIAIYDSYDGRERKRKGEFLRWADESEVEYIERYDMDAPGEDFDTLTSVFMYVDLPEEDKQDILYRHKSIIENDNMPLD